MTPPDTPMVCEYPEPAAPGGKVGEVVMVSAGVMASVIASVAVTPALSVTFTVKLNGPEAFGMPLIVLPLRVKPPGSDPERISQV